jgi:hypothetical protein
VWNAHIPGMPKDHRVGAAQGTAQRAVLGAAHALIAAALRARRPLGLRYAGAWRSVEPHILGRTSTGRLALLAWQSAAEDGASGRPGWRLFSLDRIEAVEPQPGHFTPHPTGDAPGPILRPTQSVAA